MQQLTFGLLDYFVFTTLLGSSIVIGIYFGFFSKQNTINEYLYAGKSMSYIPVAISGISSILSGITYLGFPTEIYLHGSQYGVEIIGAIISILITNHIFLPVFFKLQLLCITEYLELRFSKAVRKLCSVTYVVCLIAYSAVIIYAPSIAFSQLTGIDLHLLTLIICSICIFYTSLGGVKAVVWTDTFQFIFTFGGFVSILVLGIISVGGFSNIWETSKEGQRIKFFDLNPSMYERCTFWTVLSMTLSLYLGSFSVSQKHVQKLLTIHEEREAKKAVWAILLGCCAIKFMCLILGLTMYTRYHGCDPVKSQKIASLDQILSYFVMDIAGNIIGLPGIFLAGLISSALATLSAVLNTLGSMIYDDFLKVWLPSKYHEESKAANIMKIITALVGAMAISLVFVAKKMGTVFEISSTFAGIMGGPLLGLFVVGILLPWIGKKGALVGGYSSLLFMTWVVWGTKWHVINGRITYEHLPTTTDLCPSNTTILTTTIRPPLDPDDKPLEIFNLSFLHYTTLGTLITVVVGLITSYFANEMDTSKVNPDHISPLMQRFLPKQEYAKMMIRIVPARKDADNGNPKTVINTELLSTKEKPEVVDLIRKPYQGTTQYE